jgi:hypothetical protein
MLSEHKHKFEGKNYVRKIQTKEGKKESNIKFFINHVITSNYLILHFLTRLEAMHSRSDST